jgi:hypothetical protein
MPAAPAALTERELDRVLRKLDPRVLTSSPRPDVIDLRGRAGPDLRAAVRLLNDGAENDEPGRPERRGERLVVLAGPSIAELADALRDRAAPEVLVLARGRHREDVVRASADAGAVLADEVVRWPIRGRVRAWLPRDGGARVRRFVREQSAGRGPIRRLVARTHDGVWALAARAGLLSAAFVIVREPPRHGRDPVRRVVLAGGTRSHNRIVVATLRHRDASPIAISLHARRPQSVPGLEREARILRALAEIEPPVSGVPRLVDVHGRGEALAVVESPVDGVRLGRVLTKERFGVIAMEIAGATARFVRPAERLGPGDVADRARPILERFAASVDDLDPFLVERARQAIAELGSLPAAFEHRDLAPWNLRWRDGDRQDRLGILDWESAVEDGLPGVDLEYALAHLAFDVRGARDTDSQAAVVREIAAPTTDLGRAVADAWSAYGRAAGVDADQLARLGVLAWLLHARSEFERLAGDAGTDRAPAPAILGARFLRFVRIRLDALYPDR